MGISTEVVVADAVAFEVEEVVDEAEANGKLMKKRAATAAFVAWVSV